MNSLIDFAMKRPAALMQVTAAFCAVMIALVVAPTLAPETFSVLQRLKIDTDPENMLSADEPVRRRHNAMKAAFGLHDLIVVGVIDRDDPDGVFNPKTLSEIHALSEHAQTIRWTGADGDPRGVLAVDLIAPTTVDSIDQAGLGAVSFSWLMPEPPETRAAALAVRDRAAKIPMLNDTLVSGDGRAIALYIPISSKDVSYRVANALRDKIATFDGAADYHITGLPIAQDQFGVEMFKQMAISAPAAMGLIFFLMWLFFRQLNLIVSPMIVAMASVIGAMGALVAAGNTVHIMSSMIPIFVMPIAVLDGVHILSDFYDRYPRFRDRRATLVHVMDELWRPMLFTTLTTCAGFGSLALTPIPPVQVFGVFVALGVFLAWLFTITLIPAYIMLMPEKAFAGFGLAADPNKDPDATAIARTLRAAGRIATRGSKPVIAAFLLLAAFAGYGVTQIEINDNPVKWFTPSHEIRVADRALNARFAGTYMAYLALAPTDAAESQTPDAAAARLAALLCGGQAARLDAAGCGAIPDPALRARIAALVSEAAAAATDRANFLSRVSEAAEVGLGAAETDAAWEGWDALLTAASQVAQEREVFKRPDVLRYVERLQASLLDTGLVGKSNAVTDIVKTVHRELLLGEAAEFRIPDSAAAVAQTLLTFENSHRPQDLYKLVTPDFRTANLWIQLKSGDNKDMNAVVDAVERFMAAEKAPIALEANWFGLTYINTVWQKKMVSGMAKSFGGSFLAVLTLMVVLFRSVWWGALSMIPLTATILMIYGLIGLIGKDYDMPIAVLSSLSLGLAIDYAIHFNARTREAFARLGDWPRTIDAVFGEPARAIARNVVVIGAGFLPLLFAPLVPYQTVGAFISAILVLAGIATLFALPAIMSELQGLFFRRPRAAVLKERSA